jgi:hypothetical protein
MIFSPWENLNEPTLYLLFQFHRVTSLDGHNIHWTGLRGTQDRKGMIGHSEESAEGRSVCSASEAAPEALCRRVERARVTRSGRRRRRGTGTSSESGEKDSALGLESIARARGTMWQARPNRDGSCKRTLPLSKIAQTGVIQWSLVILLRPTSWSVPRDLYSAQVPGC